MNEPDVPDNEPLVLVLLFPSMLLGQADFILNGILFGLERAIHGNIVSIRISNPRILARILYKLSEESVLSIERFDFIPRENEFRVRLV